MVRLPMPTDPLTCAMIACGAALLIAFMCVIADDTGYF